MKIFKIYLVLITVFFISGCYLEKDLDPKRGQKFLSNEQQARTIRTRKSILISLKHNKISAKEISELKKILSEFRSVDLQTVEVNLVAQKISSRFDNPYTDPRIKEITKFLNQFGIEKDNINILEEEQAKTDQVKTYQDVWVSFNQYTLIMPRCAGFDAEEINGNRLEGENEFGCSTESNFAQMLASPKDLYIGQKLESQPGVLNSNPIDRLQKDKAKELKIEKADSSGS